MASLVADKNAYQQWRESAEQVETIVAERSLPLWQNVDRVGGGPTRGLHWMN